MFVFVVLAPSLTCDTSHSHSLLDITQKCCHLFHVFFVIPFLHLLLLLIAVTLKLGS